MVNIELKLPRCKKPKSLAMGNISTGQQIADRAHKIVLSVLRPSAAGKDLRLMNILAVHSLMTLDFTVLVIHFIQFLRVNNIIKTEFFQKEQHKHIN